MNQNDPATGGREDSWTCCGTAARVRGLRCGQAGCTYVGLHCLNSRRMVGLLLTARLAAANQP